jgi:hypothetical protein
VKTNKKICRNTIERWAGAAAIGQGFKQGRQRWSETVSRVGAVGREALAGANKEKKNWVYKVFVFRCYCSHSINCT